MKVYLQGVDWSIGTSLISIGDLFTALLEVSPNNNEHLFKSVNRRLYVSQTDEYAFGLMLSSRSHKLTCNTEQLEDGSLAVNFHQGDPSKPPADFNFIVLLKSTGRGLYMHYHQSCAFDQFTRFCRQWYALLKQDRINAAADLAGGGEKNLEKAKRQFAGHFTGRLLIRKEKFADLVKNWKKLDSLKLTAVKTTAENNWFTPNERAKVKHVSYNMRFVSDLPVGDAVGMAAGIVERFQTKRGRLGGVNSAGEPDTVKIFANLDSYKDYEHDEVVMNMKFNPKDLSNCWAVKEMVGIIEANKLYFQTPSE